MLNFACGLQRVNALSVADAACGTAGLAVCVKRRERFAPNQGGHERRPQCTHENLVTGLMLSERNGKYIYISIFIMRFDGPAYDSILKTVSYPYNR